MIPYIVVREGANWRDVYRLVAGKKTTIGRASNNQIVLKDNRCSRMHAEITQQSDGWVLRDLESRNGTLVGKQRVLGERLLVPGDVIRIGNTRLSFVEHLGEALSNNTELQLEPGSSIFDPSVTPIEGEAATAITHRRLRPDHLIEPGSDATITRLGRGLAQLYTLALEMGAADNTAALSEVVLDGLFHGTQADSGAILLFPESASHRAQHSDLEIVAYRSHEGQPYVAVSSFLSEAVLNEKEAVLARNVADDSLLGRRDNLGRIQAVSVICAPIRREEQVIGLIHLYSTQSGRMLDPDDLEFTLAVADQLAVALTGIQRQAELADRLVQVRDENLQLRQWLRVESELVGSSESIRQINEQIARVAPTNATVLVRGESGVGKELVARALHFSSPRKSGPFVCLNCAALSESLLESELFGHEKGAFTGATERKIGKFEAADGGTLLLDEIGEMSPSTQAKFLRVLEGHAFERVGGSTAIRADVRVVAATNRDLEKAVRRDEFRRDLYYRLHVVEVLVPPLREHREDIPVLAQHFLEMLIQETGRKLRGFTSEALEHLSEHDWPGNVRELKNAVERAVVFARGPWIGPDDILLSKLQEHATPVPPTRTPAAADKPLALSEMEKKHIGATLQLTGWNKKRTAEILGIERSTLDRKIKRYGIPPPE